MASFTDVGDTVSLDLAHRGDIASIAISGTYDQTIALQREQGSKGSGSWEELRRWDTEDATVAYDYTATGDNERLRLIVLVDGGGTATATLTDNSDLLLEEVKDQAGYVRMRWYQSGPVFYDDDGVVVFDGRAGEKTVHLGNENATLLAANSGKVHTIDNVSADRTFTLPPVAKGLHFRFVAEVGAADGHDWIFVAAATADLFKGGVLAIDTDAAPAVASAVVADQSDDDQLQVNLPQGGTWIDFYCDGTFWIVSGVVMSTAAPAFS